MDNKDVNVLITIVNSDTVSSNPVLSKPLIHKWPVCISMAAHTAQTEWLNNELIKARAEIAALKAQISASNTKRTHESALTKISRGEDKDAIRRAATGLQRVWGEENTPAKAINFTLAADIALREAVYLPYLKSD